MSQAEVFQLNTVAAGPAFSAGRTLMHFFSMQQNRTFFILHPVREEGTDQLAVDILFQLPADYKKA